MTLETIKFTVAVGVIMTVGGRIVTTARGRCGAWGTFLGRRQEKRRRSGTVSAACPEGVLITVVLLRVSCTNGGRASILDPDSGFGGGGKGDRTDKPSQSKDC